MPDFNDTVPWPPRHAAHAASEHDEDDRIGEQQRETEAMGALLVYAALVVLSLAALVIVSSHF